MDTESNVSELQAMVFPCLLQLLWEDGVERLPISPGDLMFMALDRQEAHLFFQLVNKLYGQASIILTSNKGPEDWGELLGDPAVTTAILDRILHRSEVIHLTGDSYRLKHRQTIFGNC